MAKNVFITGASSGFGLLTTKTLLNKGFTVFASMRNLTSSNAAKAEEIKACADQSGGKVHLIELDVTNDTSVTDAVRMALALEGGIDVVINNAGLGVGGLAETFTTRQLQKLFDVNVFGVQRVLREVLPGMRQHGHGLVINVSSIMGRFVIPFSGPYTATKYALEGLTETYRYELSNTGVDVAIVEPGGFMTGFAQRMGYAEDQERAEAYGAINAMGEQMWGGFMETLKNTPEIDPQLVADAILNLINTKEGERPLRTIVDPMTGGGIPQQVNQLSDTLQKNFFEHAGIGELLKFKSKNVGV